MTDVADRIAELVQSVERHPRRIGLLSTGEAIAVAMVLNDARLLPEGYTTWAEAALRLGREWLQAAVTAQRDRPSGERGCAVKVEGESSAK